MDRTSRELQSALANAGDYKAWREAALELDRREGLDEWREDETSDDYDWRLIRSRLRQLRQYRADNDIKALVHHLRQGLHWNLGNIGNPALYAVTQVGTKHLIHDFLNEVVGALDFLCDQEFPGFGRDEKLKFFHDTALSYGRSALMLSGGATLGLFHVGVLKALYREDVLPVVISGSSAGSAVAAVVGTRAPHEMEDLLIPENSYYHFWRMLPLSEMVRRRSIMDPAQVRRAIAKNVRDYTFEEAFEVSGRAINITVSPTRGNQPTRLLNYLTFPYVYVREAVLASSSVPLLFPPVMLMAQDEHGNRVPYLPLLKWNDGSLKSDLPVLRMRRLHNVNHFIVSQTNPHVIPFMTAKTPGEEGVLHAAREFVYSTVRHQARNVINLARANMPLSGVKHHLEVASSILGQNYRGNVTIFPHRSLWRFMRVTSNPNMRDVSRFILEGERATWARMSQVRNQVMISQALDRCLQRLIQGDEGGAQETPARRPDLRIVRSRRI